MWGEIAQVLTALAALGAVAASIHNSKKITEIHVLMNSRLTELLSVTRLAAHAEGAEQERARTDPKP